MKLLISIVSAAALFSMATPAYADPVLGVGIPIDQIPIVPPDAPVRMLTPVNAPTTCDGATRWSSLPDAAARMRALNLSETHISVRRTTSSVSASAASMGNVARQQGQYVITYEYIRYCNQPVTNANRIVGVVRVGVALRVTANIRTKADNVSVTGLIPISFAASRNRVQGQLAVGHYGFSSGALDAYLPSITDLSDNSVQAALQAVAAAKAILEQTNVDVAPVYLEIAEIQPGGVNAGVQALTSAQVAIQ